MSLSRELLLGYLLGALEASEQAVVEAELANNPSLQVELTKLQMALGQLGLDQPPEAFEPPAGLAEQTLENIAENTNQNHYTDGH